MPPAEVEKTKKSNVSTDHKNEDDLVLTPPELEEMEEVKEEIPKTKLAVKRMVKRRIRKQPKVDKVIENDRSSSNKNNVTPKKKVRLVKRKIIRKNHKESSEVVNIDPDLEGMDLGLKKNDPKEVLYEALENIDELLDDEDIFSSSEKKKKTLN